MRDQRNPRGSSPRNSPLVPAPQDAGVQRALLVLVLVEQPTQLTISELVRELSSDLANFGERDAVERAVRDLVGVGLLRQQGIFVVPTRAALHFEWLESGARGEEQR